MTAFKLASFQSGTGIRSGLVADRWILDVQKATGHAGDESVLNLLSDWDAALKRLDSIAGRIAADGVPLSSVKLSAPIPMPGAILCAGANYSDHAAEMAARTGQTAPDPRDLGLRSWHFMKASRAVVGPDATVKRPAKSKKLDWEVELAVVIGRKATNVSEADALNYVMGYTVGNDLSARDLGKRDQLPDSSSFKHDWLAHKSFDGSCPMGPWIVLARDIADPHDLALGLDVNGVNKQNSNTKHMIYNIREQIADLSEKMTLWPGDVIMTGTPSGVGAGRNEFLNSGDVVRAYVEKIGEIVTKIG